jgi:hypothetical protein
MWKATHSHTHTLAHNDLGRAWLDSNPILRW